MKRSKRLAAALILALSLAGCGGDDDSGTAPPPAGEADYSPTLAVELARLSLYAYQQLSDFQMTQPFSPPQGYSLQAQFYTDEAFAGEGTGGEVPIAYIATKGAAIYVVFRGTKTIDEWITDAKIDQVAYTFVAGGGETEEGFTNVYATIHTEIVAAVDTLAAAGSYTTLYITGHSLGAALALLAAPELAKETTFAQPIVYTFAGPRVGDPTFVDLYQSSIGTTWRVVNTNDEVPKLPPVSTVIAGPPPDFKPKLVLYEHVEEVESITFGVPITHVADLLEDHSLCGYYNTLCEQTATPAACRQMADGADGCNPS